MEENARAELKIYGRVQGVFYRARAQDKAQELGLTGWVKNTADGIVECLAEGKKEDLEKFIAWCYEGSKTAQVAKVEVKWLPFEGEFRQFVII